MSQNLLHLGRIMFSHRMAKLSKICSLTVLLFLSIQAVFAAPGDLDLTFNGIGIVTTTVTNTNDAANAVAVQTDGKIIAAGYGANGTEFVLARYTASGALDTTFDTDGIVRYVYPNSNGMAINAMALQPDGKILVAGYIIPPGSSNRRFSLARYLTNGSLDSTFGTGGVVITPDVAFGLFISEINAIAIQADGKIVATGIAQSNVGIARYNTNGSLDTSFNSIGFVSTILTGGSEGNGVKIQTDGKIVVAGRSGAQFSTTTLVRYTANGSLDNSFDNDGIVTTAAGPGSAMVIQPDGKIVVVTETTADYNVIRYNTNGSLDTGFGTNGIAATNAGGSSDSAKGVALDAGGSILVTGFSGEPKLGVDVFLSRHNSNGSLDPTFDGGGDGVVITDIGTFLDESNAIALSNSKIVIVGKLRNSATDDDFAVLRYNGNTPTVANVTLGGRIIKPNGSGVSGVRVILTGGSLTGPRVSLTSSFGYYNFYDLPAGQTYIVTPESTRYTFSPTNQVISLVDEFLQANFTAN
jgi:uncharacterized delta-60 repeat protein